MTREAITVRLQGGGNPRTCKITDQDGRPIDGVVALRVEADCRSNSPAIATLELLEFDLDAELRTTARRYGLAPRPLVKGRPAPWYLRPQPWPLNLAAAIALLELAGAIALAALR